MVQQANNSQNLNRYSYVINNPLRYTDPSGYNFLDLAAKWMPTVMAVVVAAIPGIGPVMGGAMAGWVGSGFTLKGAALGAFSGAIFNGIGNTFGAGSGFFSEGGLGHITSHGLAGGVISVLRGGNFGHGFFSAGLSKAALPLIGGIPTGFAKVAVAALIGGSVSKLTGGKFANGAATAAFARWYNDESHKSKAEALTTIDISKPPRYIKMAKGVVYDKLPTKQKIAVHMAEQALIETVNRAQSKKSSIQMIRVTLKSIRAVWYQDPKSNGAWKGLENTYGKAANIQGENIQLNGSLWPH